MTNFGSERSAHGAGSKRRSSKTSFKDILAHDPYITGLTFQGLRFFYWHGTAFAVVTFEKRRLATPIPRSANDLPIPRHLTYWEPRGTPIDNWRTDHDGTPSH
ncbi:MAG: hypothetical protein C0482_14715 [Gordonia sp.]|nr:hypothetical protein [Gordonia sp. (in: high G+C Gram-positive bacteria)]